MNRVTNPMLAAAILAIGLTPGHAHAAVSYAYATAPTTLTPPADEIGVDVFLQETLTDGSASLVAADGGLASAAFRIDLVAGSGVAISDLAFNPAFDLTFFNVKTVAADTARLTESVAFNSPGVPIDGGSGRVYLGTAWFTGDPGASATFRVEIYDDNGGNVLTNAGLFLDLDPGDGSFTPLVGGAEFTVHIPEPASLALLLAAPCLLRREARKKR